MSDIIPTVSQAQAQDRLTTWVTYVEWGAGVVLTVAGVMGLVMIVRGLNRIREEGEGLAAPNTGQWRGFKMVVVGGCLLSVSSVAGIAAAIWSL